MPSISRRKHAVTHRYESVIQVIFLVAQEFRAVPIIAVPDINPFTKQNLLLLIFKLFDDDTNLVEPFQFLYDSNCPGVWSTPIYFCNAFSYDCMSLFY